MCTKPIDLKTTGQDLCQALPEGMWETFPANCHSGEDCFVEAVNFHAASDYFGIAKGLAYRHYGRSLLLFCAEGNFEEAAVTASSMKPLLNDILDAVTFFTPLMSIYPAMKERHDNILAIDTTLSEILKSLNLP